MPKNLFTIILTVVATLVVLKFALSHDRKASDLHIREVKQRLRTLEQNGKIDAEDRRAITQDLEPLDYRTGNLPSVFNYTSEVGCYLAFAAIFAKRMREIFAARKAQKGAVHLPPVV